MSIRFAADIGGTFTDVVLDDNGLVHSKKLLTTYDDPANAVISGLDQLMSEASLKAKDIELVLHGTTLATNALIERSGAKTALLTTEGHRDVLEMAFENRFEQYDVDIDRRPPLIDRSFRIGVRQRHASDGEEIIPLDQEQLASAVRWLSEQGVASYAVGYLHSYANPSHEISTLEIIKDLVPEASVSLSSTVCPEIREYERLSTTSANAYIKPLMEEYLESLELQLRSRGVTCPLLLMTSGGGLTTLDTAKIYPIRLVESGPAGGAILAEQLSKELNEPSLVSFDMGGTTAKICLIDQGSANHSRSFEVDRAYRFKKGSGLPLRIPVIEMVEIGAGGGSMSRVDPMKRIQVGPQSAGSDPGPVCYGRGGEESTVSDADAVMGKLYPKFFAGGDLTLDVDAAKFAIEEQIGIPLGLDVFAAANSVAEVVDENMAAAAKAHSSEWGKSMDARALVAFGGAAPLHAANLAKKLKISRLYIPQGAGVGSALGFLLAPARFEVVRSFFSPLATLNVDTVMSLIEEMRDEATGVVSQMSSGPLEEKVRAYIRYQGQGHEVSVLIDQVELVDADYLRERFESAYRETYGRVLEEVEAEILSWTLSLEGAAQREEWFEFTKSNSVVEAQIGESNVYMSDAELKTPVLWREALVEGEEYFGPLLITENQTTTVLPKDSSVSISQQGVLRITLGLRS